MSWTRTRLVAVGGLLALLLATQVIGVTARAPRILSWDTMVGIPTALTGGASAGPLRGINGGGLPWMLSEGHGFLATDGSLKIEVTGLVLAGGGPGLVGTNPVPMFKGLVSCVTSTGSFDNILTDAFPATTGAATAGGGNADIETTVTLPSPCIAPIVFVTSPGGAWFAATGH